jgi:hypothetical protein
MTIDQLAVVLIERLIPLMLDQSSAVVFSHLVVVAVVFSHLVVVAVLAITIGPILAPIRVQIAPNRAQIAPNRAQIAPNRAQLGSNWEFVDPIRPNNHHHGSL